MLSFLYLFLFFNIIINMKITIIPKINDIIADLVNPAIINENVEIIATVIPYGS